MIIITLVSFVLLLFYVTLICIYHYGWLKIKPFKPFDDKEILTFSVIVPARNEEQQIGPCVESLLKQNFPLTNFEIIVVDDQSTDNTSGVVKDIIHKSKFHNVSVIKLKHNDDFSSQKKAAITHAISIARYQYMILTDADCTRGNEWLSTINNFIAEKKSKMIYAPVEFKAKNIFEKIQSLEFAGLVAIGGAAIQLKNPNMCSAANLIFEKDLFVEIGGYSGNENIASGDDEFLLHKAFKLYPDHIHFLKNRKTIVKTTANVSLKQLSDQRRRWVSKSTKYENRYITAILVAAYLFNFSIVLNMIIDFKTGMVLLCVKTIAEGLFLLNVMSFFGNRKYLLFLPLAELFHILYVLIIGIWANIGTFDWKGREVR